MSEEIYKKEVSSIHIEAGEIEINSTTNGIITGRDIEVTANGKKLYNVTNITLDLSANKIATVAIKLWVTKKEKPNKMVVN